MTYDEMRPGCYDPKERAKDLALAWVDGSLPFATFPRFCGQTFMEGDDKELGLVCIQAYNDWMVEVIATEQFPDQTRPAWDYVMRNDLDRLSVALPSARAGEHRNTDDQQKHAK